MKRLLLIGLAAAAAACGGSSSGPISANEALQALPTAESIAIGTPSAQGSPNALTAATSQICTPGSKPYEAMAELLARQVNAGIKAAVERLQALMKQPGACKDNVCTWDVSTDTVEWKLVVSKSDTGGLHYDYTLSGKLKSGGDFVDVVKATIYPSDKPGYGHGTLTIDGDAANQLDPASSQGGKLQIAYDNVDKLSITVEIVGGQGPNGEKANLTFAFSKTDQGGDLQVAIDDSSSAGQQTVEIHVRWDATGAGRSDVDIKGEEIQSGKSGSFEAIECWGPATCYELEYLSVSGTCSPCATADCSYSFQTGDSAKCAFQDAAPPTVQPPAPAPGSGSGAVQ